MNTLQFAVGSIVDANTGNGLVHQGDIGDDAALEEQGRGIFTISIASLIATINTKLVAAKEGYQARSK